MAFTAPPDHYDRFMGRYTPLLATEMADRAPLEPGMRVLDVGCGPRGLVTELASRVGAENVAGIDPSPKFVAACRERNPGADVREAMAEDLPWADASFDATLSSLAVGFFSDTDAGIAEMLRVTRPDGFVGVCFWDLSQGGMQMLENFWQAARTMHPDAPGESAMAGTSPGDLAERLTRAGLADVSDDPIVVQVSYEDFDDVWEPFHYGIGPAGSYLQTLPPEEQARIGEAYRALVPDGPFTLDARAWYAQGTVPG